MKYAKFLFLALAAILIACGAPDSSGNSTSGGHTKTDPYAHDPKWVTVNLDLKTGGIDVSDAKVFTKKFGNLDDFDDETPVYHSTVAELETNPVKMDIGDSRLSIFTVTLEKPNYKIGDEALGEVGRDTFDILRSSGEESVTVTLPVAFDLTQGEWMCTTWYTWHDPETRKTRIRMSPDEHSFGCGMDAWELGTKGFDLLGLGVLGFEDVGLQAKGSVSEDGTELDYVYYYTNPSKYQEKAHCMRVTQ